MTLTKFQLDELRTGLRLEGRHEIDRRPFYWRSYNATGSAPSGWYQWTDSGLIYLGESILERA